jgi:hypothetical protein
MPDLLRGQRGGFGLCFVYCADVVGLSTAGSGFNYIEVPINNISAYWPVHL